MPDYPEDVPSWLPVDLSTYLDGSHKPVVPTLLARTDGVCLLYPGLIHSLHGESESGKSLVAQYLGYVLGSGPCEVCLAQVVLHKICAVVHDGAHDRLASWIGDSV